jgi:hypothetical protein
MHFTSQMKSLRTGVLGRFGYLRIILMLLMVACTSVAVDESESERDFSAEAPSHKSERSRRGRFCRHLAVSSHTVRSIGSDSLSALDHLSVAAGQAAPALVALKSFELFTIASPTHPSIWFRRSSGTRGPPPSFL